MRFLSLVASNLFSLGEDVTINLNARGLLLIKGWSYDEPQNENGAGKSSLISKALTWAIYGKTIGGTTGDKVINRHTGKKKASASLVFEADDKTLYSIVRSRTPNNLFLSKLRGIEGVEWFWDDISRKTSRATQEAIELLIGRSFNTFRQAEFFGQSRKESFFELAPSAQTETIQSILPMEQLDQWAETAKESYNKLGKQLDSTILEYASKETLHKEVKKTCEDTFEKEKAWGTQTQSDVDELFLKIKELEKDNGDIPAQIQQAEAARDTLDNAFSRQAIIDTLKEKHYNLKQKLINTTDSLTTRQTILKDWEDLKKQNEIDLGRLISSTENICHACNQPVPEETIEKFRELTKKSAIGIEECKNQAIRAKEKVGEVQRVLMKLGIKCAEIEDNLTSKEKEKDLYHSLCAKITSLKSRDVSGEIQYLQEDRAKLMVKENPFTQMVVDFRLRMLDLSDDLKKINLRISNLNYELKNVNFWIQGYGRHIKTFLLNQACPFLQDTTNIYLSELGNSQISVKFSTIKDLASGDSKDQFNVTVESKTGGAEFDLLSGGEQQIASFAVGLALADLANTQTSGSSNLIVLDEPFENLSPKNSAAVVEFLTTRLPKETVLLISNEAAMLNLVPNSIRVIKRGGISSVE